MRFHFFPEDILNDIAAYRTQVADHHPEADSLFQRLTLEVEDIIVNFLDIFREIAVLKNSSIEQTLSPGTPTSYDNLLSFNLTHDCVLSNEPSKHRVIKRGASDDNRKPGSPDKSSQTSSTQLPSGIIANITAVLLKERNNYLSGRTLSNIPQLQHIENPIFSIARAGFGMLGR